MDIYLQTVQFEITRKCNENCIHCCRGEMQNMDLSKKVVDAFFDNNKIVFINKLLLSGGEPTLSPDSFEYLVNKIIERHIQVNFFEFSINGLVYNEKFVNTLNKLNDYCLSLKGKKYKFGGVFWISGDQFHKIPSQDVLDKYNKIPFFVPYETQKYTMEKDEILPVGRALKNNLSSQELDTTTLTNREIPHEFGFNGDNEFLTIKYLYVSSNGNIQNDDGSMYSYDLIDKYSFGNILNKNLEDIIIGEKEIKK